MIIFFVYVAKEPIFNTLISDIYNLAPTSATYILPKPFPLPALVDVLANDTSPLINTDPHTVTMV